MNLIKRLAALLLTGTMIFALAACSPKLISVPPSEMIANAAKKIAVAKDMTGSLKAETEMAVGENKSAAKAETDIKVVYEPLNMHIFNKSNTDGDNETTMETFVDEANGTVSTYVKYGDQWMKQSLNREDALMALRMYDVRKNMETFLTAGTDWKEISRENKVVKLEGTLTAETLKTIVEETKSLQMVGMAGLTPEYYEGISDLKITVLLDEMTGYPISYNVDFGSLLQVVTNNVMKNLKQQTQDSTAQIKVVKYNVTVACSQIGKTPKTEVSKEALKSAVDFEEQMAAQEVPKKDAAQEIPKKDATQESGETKAE